MESAIDASLRRLKLEYVDLYLIHTPYAFQPGDDQDPRDQNDQIIYDAGISLAETWRAMEELVDRGKCRAIGLSDVNVGQIRDIFERARIKPSAVQVKPTPIYQKTKSCSFAKAIKS